MTSTFIVETDSDDAVARNETIDLDTISSKNCWSRSN